jgi:hypothetical protein
MTDLVEGRRPAGRPRGSKNRNRAATVETIANQADPIGWQVRALKRGWVRGKGGVREYLDPDQKISLAVGLGRKILPDLRTADVTAIKVEGTNIIVQTGIARSPTSPPLTPDEAERWRRIVDHDPPALPPPDICNAGSRPVAEEQRPDVGEKLPAGRSWHPSSPSVPQPASPSSDRLHDSNLQRERSDDDKVAAINGTALKYIA